MGWGHEQIHNNEGENKTLAVAHVLESVNAERAFEKAGSVDDLKAIVRAKKTLLEDDGVKVWDGDSAASIIDAYAHANHIGREFIFKVPNMFPQIKSLREALVEVLNQMSRAA